MAQFNTIKLTNLGLILMNKVQTGIPLNFTKMGIGDGYLPDGQVLEDLTELISKKLDLSIVSIDVNADGNGTASIKSILSNENLTEGIYVREIGLYANDPDNGEILYCIANAGASADFIPAKGRDVIENELEIVTVTGNAETVTAVVVSNTSMDRKEGSFTAIQDNTTVFQITDIPFNPNTDKIELFYKGIKLTKGVNYNQTGTEITLSFAINKDEIIFYNVLKFVNNTVIQADGSNLQNNSVAHRSLTVDVQEKINKVPELESQLAEKATQSDLNTTNSNLLNTDIIAKDAQTKANNPLAQITYVPSNKIAGANQTDDEKMKLINMGTEVIQAIAGSGVTINPVPGDGTIGTAKLASQAVTIDKMLNPLLPLSSKALTFNYKTATITIKNNCYALKQGKYITLPGATISSFTSLISGVSALVYIPSTSSYAIYAYNQVLPNESLVLAYIIDTTVVCHNYNAFSKIDSYGNVVDVDVQDTHFVTINNSKITFNHQTKTITFGNGVTVYYPNGTYEYLSSVPSLTKDMTDEVAYRLVFYPDDKSFAVYRYNETPLSKKYYIVGIFAGMTFYCINPRCYITINSLGKQVTKGVTVNDLVSYYACILKENAITIDFVNTTISFNSSFYISDGGINFYNIQNAPQISFTVEDALKTLIYDTSSGTMLVKKYNEGISNNSIILAHILGKKVYAFNISAFSIIGGTNFNWADNRFVVPDTLYLVKDVEYSLSAHNFNYQPFIDDDNFLFEVQSPTFTETFKKSAVIKSPATGSFNANLVGIYNKDLTNGLAKSIKMQVSGKTKTNTIPKIIMIGDSVTYYNLGYTVRYWLQQWGINPQLIGTATQGDLTFTEERTYGEGRGGWRFTDFAGLCTHDGAIFPAGMGNQFKNPFLNPSTNQIDFAYYMTTNGYSNIDFIHIALGINDLLNYSAQGVAPSFDITGKIANMKQSIDILVNSIHAYDSNIKIGICPPIMSGLRDTETYRKEQKQYIEEEIAYIKNMTNVYTLGNYLATGIIAGKVDTELGTAFSSINNTRKLQISNNVHDLASNQYINGLWTASWIMNMLT